MGQGQRILSEGWVKSSVELAVADVAPTNSTPDWGYGYQWWLREDVPNAGRLIAARGYGGQFLIVVPSRNLVTVINGWDIFDRQPVSMTLFLERILPAVH
jgi:CubicO group peptidase (beta-lactamase class C family)